MSNPQIHVILDTNIYRNNPKRDNLAFRALVRLCEKREVQLYIPYVVEREFSTQQMKIQNSSLQEGGKTLNKLEGAGLHKSLKSEAKKISDSLEQLLKAANKNGCDFSDWLERVHAKRLPLSQRQAKNAMEAYFEGTPPFKQEKVRKDIPDSFIYQSVKELVDEESSLIAVIAVAEDRKLREAFEEYLQITCCENLNEFMKHEDVAYLLWEEEVHQNLPKCLAPLMKIIKQESENVIGEAICHETVESMPEESEATVMGYGNLKEIKFAVEDASYYGEGTIGLTFTALMEASYVYYLYKADYLCLEEPLPSVADHNDYVYEAESERELTVEGVLEIKLDFEEFSLGASTKNTLVEVAVDEISSVSLPD